MNLPEELVNQFRTVAQERLARIEAAWAQVMTAVDDDAAAALDREIHTLKGESKMLGFSDVNVVCHKLEDLIEVARARGYAVDEDFDLTVNMALRFMTMLARKKVGSQLGGIDLPGFIRQIDQVLAETRPEVPRARSSSLTPLNRTSGAPRVPTFLRDRLAPIAVESFVEYACASGPRRDRLRSSWHALRDMVGLQRAVVGPAQLVRLERSVQSLARELGKDVEVKFELASAEVTTEVLAAIDIATLHLARNAIDHGIEPTAERVAAGKPGRGTITLRGGMRADRLIVELEDDGIGIQFDKVRARAVDLGISPTSVQALDHDRLIELMCQPGFTTRAVATDVSGRGVGLDAVRTAVVELGGSLSATSAAGRGTTWTVSVPVPRLGVQGHVFRLADLPFPVMIDGSWLITSAPTSERMLDPAVALGFPAASGGMIVWFERASDAFGMRCERAPTPMIGRRLVVTPARAYGEVVLLDSVEALLVRPELM